MKTNFWLADFTEIYFDQTNSIRFRFCVFQTTFGLIMFIKFDSLFKLIDNIFLPDNGEIILIGAVILFIPTIVDRFELIMAEINNKLWIFKSIYYSQENVKRKHGLN